MKKRINRQLAHLKMDRALNHLISGALQRGLGFRVTPYDAISISRYFSVFGAQQGVPVPVNLLRLTDRWWGGQQRPDVGDTVWSMARGAVLDVAPVQHRDIAELVERTLAHLCGTNLAPEIDTEMAMKRWGDTAGKIRAAVQARPRREGMTWRSAAMTDEIRRVANQCRVSKWVRYSDALAVAVGSPDTPTQALALLLEGQVLQRWSTEFRPQLGRTESKSDSTG